MRTIYSIILLLFAVGVISYTPSFPKENNVIVLTEATIDEALQTIPKLIIKFYAPWCPHCLALAPEYATAAGSKEIKEMGVAFAKVDVEYHSALLKKYGIRGFPTLIYFENGTKKKGYNGGRDALEIIKWFTKQLISPSETLTKYEEVQSKYENSKEVSLVYFGNDSKKIEVYNSVAINDNDHEYGLCKDKTIMKKYNVDEETMVLFKPFDERKEILKGKDLTKDSIKTLIKENEYPLIVDLTEGIQISISGRKDGLFVFRKEPNEQMDKEIKKIAHQYKGKLQFVIANTTGHVESKIMNYLGYNKTEQNNSTKIVLLDHVKDGNKWKFTDKYSEENLIKFINDWIKGKYVPPVKSEEIPKEQKGAIYKLVNKSFKKEVLENDLDVFVKFYSPYCGHCKRLAPAYEEMAKKFESQKDKVRIAEFDMSSNDFDLLKINGYPTLIFWKAGEKDKPIHYSGDRSVTDLTNFVVKNAKHQLATNKTEPKADL